MPSRRRLALADFNQDGLLDPVAAATQGGDAARRVAVLRNRGQWHAARGRGRARRQRPHGGWPSPMSTATALPDLLVSGDSGELAIFSGARNGFGEPHALEHRRPHARPWPRADLNGDAQPDIVAADGNNNRVAVSLSQGGGRFAAATLYSTSRRSPPPSTIGDFNGDGRPDLAAIDRRPGPRLQGGPQPGQTVSRRIDDCSPAGYARAPGKASVLLQQPNGASDRRATPTVEETPIGIAAVDANCDGKDDLLVANLASSTVSVLRSNGDGTFTTVQTLPARQVGQSPIAVAVADFNRDGVDDFAVTNTVAPQTTSNVHLFKGQLHRPLRAFPGTRQVHIGELANAIVARDFTGDQIVDLAVVSQTSNKVCLLRRRRATAADARESVLRRGEPHADRHRGRRLRRRRPLRRRVGEQRPERQQRLGAVQLRRATTAAIPSRRIRRRRVQPALRGDGNGDGVRSAADLVAVAAEVMDGDGFQVEDDRARRLPASPGVDANGDGRVDAQDRLAVAHRIFSGGA